MNQLKASTNSAQPAKAGDDQAHVPAEDPTPAPTRDKQGRFLPGASGNPKGRTQGSRCRAAILGQALLDEKAEVIVKQCIDLAMEGDSKMLKIVLERLIPVRRDAPVQIDLPPVKEAKDIPMASGAILKAATDGLLTPSEATALAALVQAHGKAVELADIDERVSALEGLLREDKAKRGASHE